MGNPNSLAFFAALCLPAAFALFAPKARLAVVAALAVTVLATKSASGVLAFSGCLLYRGCLGLPEGFFKKHAFGTAAAVLAISAVLVPVFSREKLLSLGTRASIVTDEAAHVLSDPGTFFLGDGAGAVERSFSSNRSDRLSEFVAPDVPIDRAHFLPLDLAAVFGIPFALLATVSMVLTAFRKNLPAEAREVLGIFFVLSLLHTPGVGQWVLALASAKAPE